MAFKFNAAEYKKKMKAWESRKSMRWYPSINKARRELRILKNKVECKPVKNYDPRQDLENLMTALLYFIDAAILQMDDTDDRLKELEAMVVNNLEINLSQKEMNSIVNKVSRL